MKPIIINFLERLRDTINDLINEIEFSRKRNHQ